MSFFWLAAPPGPAPALNTWPSAPGESEERASTRGPLPWLRGTRSKCEVLNSQRGIPSGHKTFPALIQVGSCSPESPVLGQVLPYTFQFSKSQARCQKELLPGSLLPVRPQVLLHSSSSTEYPGIDPSSHLQRHLIFQIKY